MTGVMVGVGYRWHLEFYSFAFTVQSYLYNTRYAQCTSVCVIQVSTFIPYEPG
jgi:hypothetical protein